MRKRMFLKSLASYMLPVLIPIIVLGMLSIFITQTFIKESIVKSSASALVLIKTHMQSMFDEIYSLNLNFSTNTELLYGLNRFLRSPYINPDDYAMQKMVKNMLSATSNARPYISSIYLYTENKDGRFLTTTGDIASLSSYFDSSWYESYRGKSSSQQSWIELRTYKQYEFEESATRVLSFYNRLYSGNGVIVLNLDVDYLETLLSQLEPDRFNQILMFDNTGQVIFGTNIPASTDEAGLRSIFESSEIFSEISYNGRPCVVFKLNYGSYGWQIATVTPAAALYHVPRILGSVTAVILAVSFSLAITLTYLATKKATNSILQIASIVEAAESGRPLPELPDRNQNEYSFIVQNILKTFIQNSFLNAQLDARKYLLTALELKALQSQLNPHFLFNTLSTIYWKSVKLEGSAENAGLSDMVQNLSSILYYAFDRAQNKVAIANEVTHTKSYLDIMKARYKQKFDVSWRYSDAVCGEYKIIKLLLQPLIENAIHHGLNDLDKPGRLRISIYKREEAIRISVVDNGVGIERSRLEEIKRKLQSDEEPLKHIGIYNTARRIRLTYGEHAGMEIRSIHGMGTSVVLTIPAEL